MKISFLEKMAIKKFKKTSNKTKINLCINNIVEIYNPLSIINYDNPIENNNAKINDVIIEYIKNETENIPKRNWFNNFYKNIKRNKWGNKIN
ncbi:MAG: hypothetical protein LBB43_02390 [Spirochaetaceae bacterium]|nr:hypothetical protein [Spirochaetaceae bacterium]